MVTTDVLQSFTPSSRGVGRHDFNWLPQSWMVRRRVNGVRDCCVKVVRCGARRDATREAFEVP
jgi:hypothetical protein